MGNFRGIDGFRTKRRTVRKRADIAIEDFVSTSACNYVFAARVDKGEITPGYYINKYSAWSGKVTTYADACSRRVNNE